MQIGAQTLPSSRVMVVANKLLPMKLFLSILVAEPAVSIISPMNKLPFLSIAAFLLYSANISSADKAVAYIFISPIWPVIFEPVLLPPIHNPPLCVHHWPVPSFLAATPFIYN